MGRPSIAWINNSGTLRLLELFWQFLFAGNNSGAYQNCKINWKILLRTRIEVTKYEMTLVPTWGHADARSVTPGMSPALHYSAYSNLSLTIYPFFSSPKGVFPLYWDGEPDGSGFSTMPLLSRSVVWVCPKLMTGNRCNLTHRKVAGWKLDINYTIWLVDVAKPRRFSALMAQVSNPNLAGRELLPLKTVPLLSPPNGTAKGKIEGSDISGVY